MDEALSQYHVRSETVIQAAKQIRIERPGQARRFLSRIHIDNPAARPSKNELQAGKATANLENVEPTSGFQYFESPRILERSRVVIGLKRKGTNQRPRSTPVPVALRNQLTPPVALRGSPLLVPALIRAWQRLSREHRSLSALNSVPLPSQRVRKLRERGLGGEHADRESSRFVFQPPSHVAIRENSDHVLGEVGQSLASRKATPLPSSRPSAPAAFITRGHPEVRASTHLIFRPVPAT